MNAVIPRVSIIMTVRNGARYLPATIAAIRAQTFGDYEVVINDNGSSDGTADLLNDYESQDVRVRVIPGGSSGLTFTQGIKRAFTAARAPLVAVNDADDVSAPSRLEKQVALLDSRPDVMLTASWYDEIDAQGNHLRTLHLPEGHAELMDASQTGNRIAHSSVMYRRVAALAVGDYRERFSYASDYRLQVGLMAAGGKLAVIPEALVKIRCHEAQTSLMSGNQEQVYIEPLEILHMASGLRGVSAGARIKGMIARQKLALRYGFAMWQKGRRLGGIAGAFRWLAASLTSITGRWPASAR